MPRVETREYRPVQGFIAKRDGDQEPRYIVEGYASTFNDPYLLYECEGDKFYEQIDRNAFDGCDMEDVIFQFDHAGMVFARTRNNTLKVSCDDHGLKIRADLSSTQASREVWEAINAGLVDRMSFAFTILEDKYDKATKTDTVTRIGKLYDVSAVSIPANPGTDISARTKEMLDGEIEQLKAERLKAEERAKKLESLKRLKERLNEVRK